MKQTVTHRHALKLVDNGSGYVKWISVDDGFYLVDLVKEELYRITWNSDDGNEAIQQLRMAVSGSRKWLVDVMANNQILDGVKHELGKVLGK